MRAKNMYIKNCYLYYKEELHPILWSYICDRIKTTPIYIESNIATISNDVGLCFRLGQVSNGSRVFRFSIKHFREISFFKMHFAKS